MISYDLLGLQFGYLQVVALSRTDKYGRAIWSCKCVCGNIKDIPSSSLRLGKSKSCGCKKVELTRHKTIIDKTGNRYGRLIVIGLSHHKKGYAYWKVLCDCGNIKTVRGDSLKIKNTQSCGCLQKDTASSKSGDKNPSWRGGRSLEKYPKEWNERLKEDIRNRDGRKCQYPDCNYDDSKESRKLCVHHIDGNKQNCSSYNLICLCLFHHMSIEKTNPRVWDNYFYGITNDYS